MFFCCFQYNVIRYRQEYPKCSIHRPGEAGFTELKVFRDNFRAHCHSGCLDVGGHFGWFLGNPLTKESAEKYAQNNPESTEAVAMRELAFGGQENVGYQQLHGS